MPYNTNNKIQLVDASGDPIVLGAGIVTTETLRVTLASDDPAVVKLGTIDTDTGNIATKTQTIADAIYADDADFTLDTDKGIAIMGYSGFQNITSGDVGIISLTGGGHVKAATNMGVLDTFVMLDIDNGVEMLATTIGTFTNCIEIFLQADESNSGYIMVGDSDVADNRGMKLNAGDTLILNVEDTRTLYLWGSAADQNVRCMVTTY